MGDEILIILNAEKQKKETYLLESKI